MPVEKQISYRANLSAAVFPFASPGQLGNTVIDAGTDQVYDRRIDPEGQTKNVGIPQVAYLANVMPTAEGYASVQLLNPGVGLVKETYFKEFDILVPDTSTSEKTFIQVKLKIPVTATQLKAVCHYGQVQTWTQFVDFPWIAQADYKTITDVISLKLGSRVFLFVRLGASPSNILYEVISTAGILSFFAVVTNPANFTATNFIHAATVSFGYLVLASNSTVYWSSLTDPLDFTSSLVTGAGSIDPNNNPINILHLKATSTGFYIFTGTNILHATYTGNSRYPFKFQEVSNAGVVPKPENTTVSSGADTAFCISADGNVSMLSGVASEVVSPELSTFVERSVSAAAYTPATDTWGVRIQNIDDLDATTFLPVKPYYYSSSMLKQCPILLLNDRYVCLSYGRAATLFSFGGQSATTQSYRFVYIYDRLLKRFGRLYYPHTQMFVRGDMLCMYNPETGITAYANFSPSSTTVLPSGDAITGYDPVVVLGKFQLTRDEWTELQELTLVGAGTPVLEYSYDGLSKSGLSTLYLSNSVSDSTGLNQRKYLVRQACKNFMVILKGTIDIKEVSMKLTGAGNE